MLTHNGRAFLLLPFSKRLLFFVLFRGPQKEKESRGRSFVRSSSLRLLLTRWKEGLEEKATLVGGRSRLKEAAFWLKKEESLESSLLFLLTFALFLDHTRQDNSVGLSRGSFLNMNMTSFTAATKQTSVCLISGRFILTNSNKSVFCMHALCFLFLWRLHLST